MAEWFGEAPSNAKACAETAVKNHCKIFHADDEEYFDQVSFWTTPRKECGDDRGSGLQGLLRLGPGVDGHQGLIGRSRRTESGGGRRPPARPPRLQARAAAVGAAGLARSSPTWARWRSCSSRRSGTLDTFSGRSCTATRSRTSRRCRDGGVYREIVLRTVGVAAAVTVTDALLAFPIAFFMAKVATPRTRAAARRRGADAAVGELPGEGLRLADDPQRTDGILNWVLDPFGLHGPGYGHTSPPGSSSPTCGCRT